MRRILALVFFSLALAGPASAATFERCEKTQIAIAEEAFIGASDIVLKAAAAVGDTEAYDRWFGRWTPARAEEVRQNLKAISRALLSAELVGICPNVGEDACDRDTYANVFPDEPFRINLCRLFFDQPTMVSFAPGSPELEYGTREGTLVHEMSHFNATAGTDDICYGRTECSSLARRDPTAAIKNADSYQYFTEDVTFYPLTEIEGEQPMADQGPMRGPGNRPAPGGLLIGTSSCRGCLVAR